MSQPETDEAPARSRLTPEERRAAVLDATVPLLVEYGIGLTTRQIADAAGVAEGTLFRVFDDKRALIVATIARALDPEPIVEVITAVDSQRELDAVLLDLVEVLSLRTAGIRSIMGVAHELRRAAADHDHPGIPHDPEALLRHPDVERAGSLPHAAHQLRSRAGQAPQRIVAAIGDVLAGHAPELRRDPAVCARILFSVVTSSFHDPLGPSEQLSAAEVVEVLLDGLRSRPSTASEAPC